MVENVGSTNPAANAGIGLNQIGNALDAILGLLRTGIPLEQAIQQVLGGDFGNVDVDLSTLAEVIERLPNGLQQQLADGAETLPTVFRDALEQLGIAHPAARADAPGDAAQTLRGEAAERSQAALAARGEASTPIANPGTATAQAPGGTIASQIPASALAGRPDRAAFEAGIAPASRPGEVLATTRADAAGANAAAERLQAVPTQSLPAQTVVAPQGRPEGLPAQIAPQLAGATVLVNPQGNTMMPAQAAGPARTGKDGAGGQAGEQTLAPGGHTVAGIVHRGLRKDAQSPPRTPTDWAMALMPGREKDGEEDETKTSGQWMFWLLTVVAFGAVVIALIAMLPGGGGLTDGFGRPSTSGYALAIGAVAAIASWLLGRRLARG